MAPRDLELEVCRGNRPEERFTLNADPADTVALRQFLADWLTAKKWDRAQWGKFQLKVRHDGEWTVRKVIRA